MTGPRLIPLVSGACALLFLSGASECEWGAPGPSERGSLKVVSGIAGGDGMTGGDPTLNGDPALGGDPLLPGDPNVPGDPFAPGDPGCGGEIIVDATEDATVLADPFDDDNFGSEPLLDVDEISSSDAEARTYIKFDLSAVPAAYRVVDLTVEVQDDGNEVEFLLTPGTWTEGSLTWNNAPAPTGGVIATFEPNSPGTPYLSTISLAGAGTGGQVLSLLLRPTDTNGVEMTSREGDPPPRLRLVCP